MKKIPPWLTLLVLAPVLGELVSGHQPPLELCNPISVMLLMLPYGLGAMVCRELVRRWKKGWLSLVLLAVAYAFYEEAIVVRSFFDPHWVELNILKPDFAAGVNWTYAMMLVHFHVLISIGASVLLAEMLHPQQREESWLGDRGLAACIVGLALWFPAGWLMTSYVPPWPLLRAFVGGDCGVDRRGAVRPRGLSPTPVKKNAPHPFYLPAAWTGEHDAVLRRGVRPSGGMGPPLRLSIISLTSLDALTLWLLLRWAGNGGAWDDRNRLAWTAGGLGFFLFFGFANDAEKFAGRSCVSLLAAAGLMRRAFGSTAARGKKAVPSIRNKKIIAVRVPSADKFIGRAPCGKIGIIFLLEFRPAPRRIRIIMKSKIIRLSLVPIFILLLAGCGKSTFPCQHSPLRKRFLQSRRHTL